MCIIELEQFNKYKSFCRKIYKSCFVSKDPLVELVQVASRERVEAKVRREPQVPLEHPEHPEAKVTLAHQVHLDQRVLQVQMDHLEQWEPKDLRVSVEPRAHQVTTLLNSVTCAWYLLRHKQNVLS